MISNRFESLAQAFRVFTEQTYRFRPLFQIDAPEAVGNLDHAVEGILNAFHGLYDAVNQNPDCAFDFYSDPLCAFVLSVRNARHHNHANGIRSIYRCARAEPETVDYILVDFPSLDQDGGGTFAEYFLSWSDILEYLNDRRARYPVQTAGAIAAMGGNEFEPWCLDQGYPLQRIFFNMIPIFVGAGIACTGTIAEHVQPDSVEAEAFLDLFQTDVNADFGAPSYTELTSGVFWPR